ncbi:hypothetical protein AVEN_103990-1 [Araneus ventricosus]|uniref:Uncharacterized protein n=1 Tax=Araneus ventricosus TaxID=182803 RepID=A0A4Y2S4Z8_ARAVE|nr:hypothetical protein AVEN_66382-1 [Araneus ventricosus]GBN82429.1 hypothetical protein AVEN_103990-1 [Araneus ventricosus]
MEDQVKMLNKKLEKYKKRNQRLNDESKKKPEDMTPKSKTQYYSRHSNKFSQVIKKKLMFGEVVSEDLTSSYKILTSDKTKQIYHMILSGKILKKYKLLAASKEILKYKRILMIVKDSQASTPDLESEPIIVGTWVAVVYDENWFPGLIEEIIDDNLKINFMLRSASRFYWPNIPDIQLVPKDGILCLIKSPPSPITSRYFIIDN